MKYREELPIDCPPHDAEEVAVDMAVFRLVRDNPPTDEDFRSQRAEFPNRGFPVDECTTRGLSVFSQEKEAKEKILKIHRLRNHLICHVKLKSGAGKIRKSSGSSHITWWPFANFDILACCNIKKP